MEWIKASERLPEKTGVYVVVVDDYYGPRNDATVHWGAWDNNHKTWVGNKWDNDNIKWLDETPNTTGQYGEEDMIAFARMVHADQWEYSITRDEWDNAYGKDSMPETVTSEELLKRYRTQKGIKD